MDSAEMDWQKGRGGRTGDIDSPLQLLAATERLLSATLMS